MLLVGRRRGEVRRVNTFEPGMDERRAGGGGVSAGESVNTVPDLLTARQKNKVDVSGIHFLELWSACVWRTSRTRERKWAFPGVALPRARREEQ